MSDLDLLLKQVDFVLLLQKLLLLPRNLWRNRENTVRPRVGRATFYPSMLDMMLMKSCTHRSSRVELSAGQPQGVSSKTFYLGDHLHPN